MAIYTYSCSKCEYTLTQLYRIVHQTPLCPHCGDEMRRDVRDSPNFILKGSGFYATDYSHGPKQKSRI